MKCNNIAHVTSRSCVSRVLAVAESIDTVDNMLFICGKLYFVHMRRFKGVFFLSFGHIGYHRSAWRWAVAVYRGIYIVYIGRLFVLRPKVGGRRGWRSKEGRFKEVLLY